jgi:hypothetical protein
MMEQRGSPVQIFADETSWRTCRVGQANELEFGREQLDRQVARTYRAAVLARIRKRMRFAAVHESANGTTRTLQNARCLTGFGGKADIEPGLTRHLKNFFGKDFWAQSSRFAARNPLWDPIGSRVYGASGPSKRRLQAEVFARSFSCSRACSRAELRIHFDYLLD